MSSRTRVGRAAGIVFYFALAGFLAAYLRNANWARLTAIDPRPIYLLAAVPFSLATRLLQPLAWATLIRGYGEGLPSYPDLTLVYAKAWLGRYIPGKVAWLGGKVLFGSRHGMRPGVLAATSVAEAGIQMITALALAFFLFAATGATAMLGRSAQLFALAAFMLATVAMTPPVFNAFVELACRMLRRPQPTGAARLTGRAFATSAGLYLVIHALSALPLFFVIEALYAPLAASHMPYVTASFLWAGTLGTLAVFAPSGIGVREGVLLVLLGVLLPREFAVAAVLMLRIWSIVMDLVYYALAEALARLRSRWPAQ
jgi:uncharacterized membrane protein YbhN (UPF0104 family)